MRHIMKDGLQISKFTLGTSQLGNDYGIANKIGFIGEDASFKILKKALELGVTTMDTSPAYGKSEEIIGKLIKSQNIDHMGLTIVTKLSHKKEIKHESKKELESWIRQSIELSMKRLGLDCVPVYLIHNPKILKDYGKPLVEVLCRMKQEGLVRNIGLSVYYPEDVEQMLSIGLFDAVQAPINIFDHRLIKTGLLSELHKRNMLVFCRSIFLQGLFALEYDEVPSYLPIAREPLKILKNVSKEIGLSPIETAFLFIRDLEGITSLVMGCDTAEQVQNNVELFKLDPLPPSVRNEILHVFKDSPDELVNPFMWANRNGGR